MTKLIVDARNADRIASKQGQVTVEYFILFAVVAAVTLIGLSTFDDQVKDTMKELAHAAANNIAN